MSLTLSVDDKNDLFRDAQGNIAVSSDLDALRQNAEWAARVQLGELIYATDEGVPYFEAIYIGAPNVPLWTEALRQTLQGVNGVLKVESLDVRRESDVLRYTATLQTIYGMAVING